MNKIPDQTPVWDRKHSKGEHEKLRHIPSPLAELSEPYFPEHSYILELGCGVGRDAEFFTQKGHRVIATDGSEVVVKQDKEYLANTTIEFQVLDMQDPYPYKNNSFDVVFANLSLHYYSHEKTREIIKEIARVLQDNGLLAFACKSTDDFHHGNGEEVEENIFVSATGHVRHLFTTEYAKQILEGLFDIKYLDKIEEEYNGQKSNIVRCIAEKSGKNWGGL